MIEYKVNKTGIRALYIPKPEDRSKLVWTWRGNPIHIDRLHTGQLESILKTLAESRKPKWFDRPTEDWVIAISKVVRKRYESGYVNKSAFEVSKYIEEKHKTRSIYKTDIIIKHFKRSKIMNELLEPEHAG